MSTQQRNSACLVSVDPSTADVLRHQTLVVLEANHYYFEEILEFGPEAQHALSVIYRDAFAVLDAIGWRRPEPPPESVGAPLTPGFMEQLRTLRYDLGHTNVDRFARRGNETDPQEVIALDEAIERDRLAALALERLIAVARC